MADLFAPVTLGPLLPTTTPLEPDLRQVQDDDEDDDDGDDDGLPAYSHHDKIPPWWEYVSNDKGGNVSVTKSHHT